MIKINEVLTYKGQDLKRVSIRKLENMVLKDLLKKKGKFELEVWCHPSKANIFSSWGGMFSGIIHDLDELKRFLNSVEYYNCNSEMGYNLHYYIKAQ